MCVKRGAFGDDIADGEDAARAGAHPAVDDDAVLRVGDAGALEVERRDASASPRSHQEVRALELRFLPVLIERKDDVRAAAPHTLDLGFLEHDDAFASQHLEQSVD